MEFFQAEFNFGKDSKNCCSDSMCESIVLPGACFCWNKESRLVVIEQNHDWTVFLRGPARQKTGKLTCREIAYKMAECLAHGENLNSYLVNLEGNFCVLAWNEKESRLVLATDPIGMMKVYYGEHQGRFIVSSHANLVAKNLGNPAISGEGLSILFSIKGISPPYTVFEGVSVLKPAELVAISKDSRRSEVYWSITDRIVPFQGSLDDAQAELHSLLESGLKRIAATSQLPLGLSMSSGVDSALIAAMLVQAGIPAQGLTVGYEPSTRNDETQGASENAKQIGLPIDVVRVSDEDIAGIVDFLTQCLPEPLGDATVLPQLLMTLAGKGKVSSMIDGTGADNIFGGMQKFAAERYARQYLRIPRFLRVGLIKPMLSLLPSSRKSEFTDKIRKMQKFSYGVELPEDDQKVYWSRFLTREAVEKIISPAYSPDGHLADRILLGIRAEVPPTFDDFFTSTYASIRGTLPTHATQKLVTLQYASGALYHTPFMTPTLIEFALSLPTSYKLSDTENKLVLRKAASKILPAECTNRKKATFSPPIGRWLMGVLKTEFMDLLQGNEVFNRAVVEKMLSDQASSWRDWQWELWLVFIFLKWMKETSR